MKRILSTKPLCLVAILGFTCFCLGSEFDDIDTNHDGVVSKKEWEAWKKKTSQSATTEQKSATDSAATSNEKKSGGLIEMLQRDFEIRESFFADGSRPSPGTPSDFSGSTASVASAASSNPARLSWTKPSQGSAFYQLDAAVLWKPSFLSSGTELFSDAVAWFVEPTFETHVSSEVGAAQDQLTYRIPLTLEYFPGGKEILAGMDNPNAVPTKRFLTVHTLMVSPTYQTDRDNNTRSIEAEIFYTPTIPSLAIGIRQRLFGLKSAQLRWRPYVGFEFGDYLNQDKTTGVPTQSSISRCVFRVEADLSLSERFALTGSYVGRIELNGTNDSFNYGEISAQVFLDSTLPTNGEPPHFSAGITYKRGQDAPDFVDVDAVSAWVGVRF